jgi:hypothetical protein
VGVLCFIVRESTTACESTARESVCMSVLKIARELSRGNMTGRESSLKAREFCVEVRVMRECGGVVVLKR